MKKINVMIVDDSALIRHVLTEILKQSPDIGTIDSAADPIFALRKMEKSWPDVVVLDIEMPRMNGIEFSRKLMREHPTPIVIISGKTEKNMALGLEALKNGATELFHKPETGLKDFLETAADDFILAIKAAAASHIAKHASQIESEVKKAAMPAAPVARVRPGGPGTLIVIGASTGGTVALEAILTHVNFPHPPIVIVQHMPAGFTAAFAGRLNNLCASEISEAINGQTLENNHVYIAPGGYHTEIMASGSVQRISVTESPPVNRHRPSVDVLFYSVAKLSVPPVLAILLTGMGADGAQGLLSLKSRGDRTVAQDQQSSVVFGMPAAAIALGAAHKILPLSRIAEEIRDFSLV